MTSPHSLLFDESPQLFFFASLFFGAIHQFLAKSRRHRQYTIAAFAVVVAGLVFAYRVPKRVNRYPSSYVVAPCDGRVLSVLKIDDETTHVAIYLSLLDVHVQWCPIHGVVIDSKYKKGSFNAAYSFSKSRHNERWQTTIYVPEIDDHVVIVQIAGQVARRIVNYKSKTGTEVRRGELYGLIKFGSRVDLFLPHRKMNVFVQKDDVVVGNKSIIAALLNSSYK